MIWFDVVKNLLEDFCKEDVDPTILNQNPKLIKAIKEGNLKYVIIKILKNLIGYKNFLYIARIAGLLSKKFKK